MPVFKLEVFKHLGAEAWGNVWHVSAADLATAAGAATVIATGERNVTYEDVTFDTVRVSDLDPDSDIFITVPINGPGALENTDLLLPLFNTLRVDFTPEAGRPGRKYFRGALQVNDISGEVGIISGTKVSDANDAMDTIIGTLESSTPVCKEDGTLLTASVTKNVVQMRQLHRKRKKATTTP